MKKLSLLGSEIEICDLQLARMEIAHKHLKPILPLTKEKYTDLSDEEISFLDIVHRKIF